MMNGLEVNLSRRVFVYSIVLAMSVLVGITVATFRAPPLLSFSLGLVVGFLSSVAANAWWEVHH